jgi:hypothetical protein
MIISYLQPDSENLFLVNEKYMNNMDCTMAIIDGLTQSSTVKFPVSGG